MLVKGAFTDDTVMPRTTSASFATTAASWQNFYLLVGTAAATLIGLMFVALTFGASLVKVQNVDSTRAFLDPTLTHFVQVLLTAICICAPSMSPLLLGGLLAVLGVLRVIALVRIHRHMREAQRTANDIELSDWITGVILPLAAYLLLIGCGIAFMAGHFAFSVLALVTVAVLMNGIYGAWELMVWLALSRARSKN